MSANKKSAKLLPHEKKLVTEGRLKDETHAGASSIWLHAESATCQEGQTNVYRPMGDAEILHLIAHNQLPDTQPYQAIIEGDVGRVYAEKYLKGLKWVDTRPTTVCEFTVPQTLVTCLFELQHKAEDGAISMGLGNKAGGGLPLFNESLKSGESSWRIVKVKRGNDSAGDKQSKGASEEKSSAAAVSSSKPTPASTGAKTKKKR